MRRQIVALVASAFVAAPAFAASDAEFVSKAASGGMMEVTLGEYAASNAADEQVKSFGRRMAEEHGRANQELESVAQRAGLMVPSAMSAEHRAKADELMQKRGAEFDRAYMRAMVEDHEKDVAEFKEKASAGKTDVERWAAKTLPTLESHLQAARSIDARVASMR